MSTEILNKLYRVQTLLHRYQVSSFEPGVAFGNPLRGQGRILSLLKMKESISQKELSYLLDMRQQSLSELLSKLDAKGLITRESSEEDRRISIVRLTEEGRSIASEAETDQDAFSQIFGCLNEDESKQFAEFLDRITGALEKELVDRKDDGMPFHGKGPREHFGAFDAVHDHFRRGHEKFRHELHGRDGRDGGDKRGHPHDDNRRSGKGRRGFNDSVSRRDENSDTE